MLLTQRFNAEEVRELAAASVAATFVAIGTPTLFAWSTGSIRNGTDKEVYISLDGSTNNMRLASGQVEMLPPYSDGGFIPEGTQFSAKQVSGAPTTGAVVIQGYYLKKT